MKIHQIKIDKEFYNEVWMGNKRFELRKNDRDYQQGDYINFIIIRNDCDKKHRIEYSNLLFRIDYVLKNYKGLEKKYCILSLSKPKYIESNRVHKGMDEYENE